MTIVNWPAGPWWWRLRCWLSQRVLGVGAWLEPEDRVTCAEQTADGQVRFWDGRMPR